MRDLSNAPCAVNSADGATYPLLASLREMFQYRQLIGELVRRDLKLRYKNSVGGILWSLLNPLMQIFVITIVIGFIQATGVDVRKIVIERGRQPLIPIVQRGEPALAAVEDGLPSCAGRRVNT